MTNLRGSMALILATLTAIGPSKVNEAEMAMGGYNDLDLKLKSIGFEIDIVSKRKNKLIQLLIN